MKAWHFVSDSLRDGSPIPADGELLKFDGDPLLCERGLHASKRLIDALQYAPGCTICRVEIGGTVVHGSDKLVATERTILWRIDGEQALRKFARLCALDVVHLWQAPEVVVRYLKTGKESIRDTARNAARDGAWDGAWDDSACYAARGASRGAARGASQAAGARAAAWAAARAAAWAADRAARAAARDASRKKQNKRLTAMVMRAHRKEGTDE